MSEEKKLNKQQLEAVTHGPGPLLIIAGAGTGKTTVVTERVKYLISHSLAQPGEILALTFTEKAAAEMEERIDVALPYGYTQMWVNTFHSFCDRILRDEALSIGLDPAFNLLTDADSVAFLSRHIFDFDLDYYRPLGNPTKFIASLLQHISRLKDEDVSPAQYQKWAKSHPDPKYIELANLYFVYETLKAKEGVLDFSDLISRTLDLFRTRPQILGNYQQKFKYILVDEYQDTNYAQNQLVNLLASYNRNLTVVADDDQAIYRWRGAAVSNVIQFRATYPDSELVVLTQNYRSTQEILDRAYGLIQKNNPDRLEVKEGIDKKLISTRKVPGEPIEFIHRDRVENEADAVAKKIKELLSNDRLTNKLTYKNIAILVRANAHADAFVQALSRHGLPYQFLGPGRLFQQPEVKDLIAYLKVLDHFDDSASFYRVLAMDYFGLSGRDLAAIGNFAKRQNTSLFEACEHPVGIYISPDAKDTVKQLVDLIHKHLALVPKLTAGQILYDFLSQTGLLRAILDYRHPLDERKAQNIMKFFNKLKFFETNHADASVTAVVDWLDLALNLGESPLAAEVDWNQNDAVNILTLHSAKGLEFSIVFLVNLVAQRFPTTERREAIPIPDALIKEILPEGDFHLEEERRLFYVGLTRARDRLFLTAADYYGEGKRLKKLSPFIAETLGPNALTLSSSPALQLSILDWQSIPSSSLPGQRSNPVTINYLSYSQIQTFLDCPLHYKAKYILKIPTPPSAASSFGNTIHQTLKNFYQQKGQVDIVQLLHQSWSSEGYKDKSHEKLYLARGEKFLRQFVAKFFDPLVLLIQLEQPFTVPLNPNLKIGGKIDRVDSLPGGKIEIIDYKTGTPREEDAGLQLSFYALAATILQEPPFNCRPQDVSLSLIYLESAEKKTVTKTAADLAQAKQQIVSYADQISRSDYKCSGSALCKICDFKILCDFKTASATE